MYSYELRPIYSLYKHHNTVKYLIGITAQGIVIIFLNVGVEE